MVFNCAFRIYISHYLQHTVLESQERMYYGFEESTSVGLVFVLVSVRCPPVQHSAAVCAGAGAGLRDRHPRHHGAPVQEARLHRGGPQQVPRRQLQRNHQRRDCQVKYSTKTQNSYSKERILCGVDK